MSKCLQWICFRALNATYQVILPALGSVFRVPLLLWRAHWGIHIGRVSIAVVAWIISPVPTSPSHSGELKSKQKVDSNLQANTNTFCTVRMEGYFNKLGPSQSQKSTQGRWKRQNTQVKAILMEIRHLFSDEVKFHWYALHYLNKNQVVHGICMIECHHHYHHHPYYVP